MKRTKDPGTEWTLEVYSGLRVLARGPGGQVLRAHLQPDWRAPSLHLRIISYEHLGDDDTECLALLTDFDPPPLAWIESEMNRPENAMEIIGSIREAGWSNPYTMKVPKPPPGFKGPYPESFYGHVAAFVRICHENGIAVGPRLAEDNDVPTTTVYRWIREAKRRGLLYDEELQ